VARGAQGTQSRGELGELLRLAGPVVLARLGIMAMGLTDAIVVGRHSSTELGYHALGWAPTATILTTAVGLLTGVQVMTARYVGEGRGRKAGMVLRRGLSYSLLVGIVSAALLWLFGPAFLHASGIEPDLARGSAAVLRIFCLSLPPYLLCVALTFWLEALGRPMPGMVTMWAANAVNLALNLWLVPGDSVFGVQGAVASAWATFGARVALMAMLFAYILMWRGARDHGAFDSRDDGAGGEQRRIGYAAGASYFVEAAAFSGMSFVAGLLGSLEVAAWAVVLNVAAIIFMGPLGLSSATAVLVGRAFGARDSAGVTRAGLLGFGVAAALTGGICLVVWLGAEPIARAYATDPALIRLVTPALLLSCLFFVADGVQVVASNALRARGDIWVPTATHILSYAVVMLPLGWLLAHPVGLALDGIVWAVVVASLVAAGFLLARFAWLSRRPLPLDAATAVG
jgi:MATE family multidrug resistance protein